MNQDQKRVYWCGEPLDEMSREQLLDVVKQLVVRDREHFSMENMAARAYGRVEMLKRGVKT